MQKIIKRLVSAALLLSLVFLPTLFASADVLYEPHENAFFDEHRREIELLRRNFVVNSDSGSVQVMRDPRSSIRVNSIDNGTEVHIYFLCQYNGEYWGFIPAGSDEGWVRMDELLLKYDFISFAEEYGHEFYPHTGDYASIEEAGGAILWPWPGADSPLDNGLGDIAVADPEAYIMFGISHLFLDEDGNEWGFGEYVYGIRNIWFCMSDPMNPDLRAIHPAPAPMVWSPDTVLPPNITGPAPTDSVSNAALIAGCIISVVVLVVVTVILIKVFWKPKKQAPGSEVD